MRKNKRTILGFLFTLLFIDVKVANAQTELDSSIGKIAAMEKTIFQKLSSSNRSANGLKYAGTTASDNFDVNFYRCEWEIDPSVRFIKGKVTTSFTLSSTSNSITFDLSDTLKVDSVTYHGAQINFTRIVNDGLQLLFPAPLNAGQKDSISIYYNGVPRNTPSYRAFVQSSHSSVPIIWTLSEPFGAKEWWPCKNGLNDKADSIDIIITTPSTYQASTNGVMTNESIVNSQKISTWKHRFPIASYLVAIAVTNYEVSKDSTLLNGQKLDIINYAYPESKNNFSAQLPYTKYALNLLTRLFGDYPFIKEKYGFTQFDAGGGMEHQTNSFVTSPTTALIVHESGHQWFGDEITCGSWKDIWLNEGFASYCQVLEFENSDKAYFYLTLKSLISVITSSPNGSVLVSDTTDAARIFDTRLSYYKGCYLLHMLRGILGDSVFFKGVKRYLNDPLLRYNFAKTNDLQRNLEQESGKNLNSFFDNWFTKEGYPIYDVAWTQDDNSNLYLKINQSVSNPSVSFYDMPVPIQFKNSSRDTTIIFDNKQNGQTFLVNPGFKADTAIFDPLYWLLCHNNIKKTDCTSATSITDNTFPFYSIQWYQNSNNWIYTDINQTNTAASAEAKNIPLYLHFSGNGKDTVILIKNLNSHSNLWINAGFTVTNVFVTTSCLLSSSYSITNNTFNSTANDIKIFPVPVSNNTINISLKNPSDKYLNAVILSATGQLIFQAKFQTPGKDELFTLPVNNLPKGVYIIRLQSESAIRLNRKVIK